MVEIDTGCQLTKYKGLNQLLKKHGGLVLILSRNSKNEILGFPFFHTSINPAFVRYRSAMAALCTDAHDLQSILFRLSWRAGTPFIGKAALRNVDDDKLHVAT
jgi:hypothetical protein